VSGNETLLSGDDGVFDALGVSGEETPVSELSPSSQVVECWTCGTQVERQAIADRLGELRDLIERKREERSSVRDDLSELNSERDTIEKRIAERDELDDRLSDLDREVKRRRSTLRDLEEQSDDLRDRIADLRAEFEGLEELQERDLTDTYQEVSELEYERGHLEQELTEVTDEITEIEYEVGKKERLEEEIESIEAKISELRTRIDELERDVIERFNGQMDEILEILGYDNVTRVWLERVSASIATAENASFALHVVRESEDGTVYEDTVDHLSESEREVVGLVAALSGYLAHEVHERAPVVILDSLEAIDADRIAALVDYFTGVSGYVLVALLPEDAAALSDAYERLPAAALR
jgi:predicted  nucleic acid-binding Zn-ribbon protein